MAPLHNAARILAVVDAERERAPGPEFDAVKAAIRAAGHCVTPYRIGLFMVRLGLDLPCPYAAGSAGQRDFRDGVKWERNKPRAKATGSAA